MTSASPSLTNLQSLSGSSFSAQVVPRRVLSRLLGAGAPSAAQVRPTHARARIERRMGATSGEGEVARTVHAPAHLTPRRRALPEAQAANAKRQAGAQPAHPARSMS